MPAPDFDTLMAALAGDTPFAGDVPPTDWPPALRGVWHALRGDWQAAHAAVDDGGADCAWVHAALHREEGDLPNADYWYGRAKRPRARGSARDEYLAIAAALSESGSGPPRDEGQPPGTD